MVATNLEDAAFSIGIDARTLQRWIKEGCPGKARNYPIRDIVLWARDNKWNDSDQALIDSIDGADDIKAKLLKERAEKLERENRLLDFKIQERESNLVDADEVRASLLPLAESIREAAKTLERKYGRDASDVVIEAIEQMRREIRDVQRVD